MVIKYEGPKNVMIWKYPAVDFKETTEIIIDDAHDVILFVNKIATDMFKAGNRVFSFSFPNIPITYNLLKQKQPENQGFQASLFFVKKVRLLDFSFETRSPLVLEDPLYDVLLHLFIKGRITIEMVNVRKHVINCVECQWRELEENGFSSFEKYSETIKQILIRTVTDCVAKIMINGMLSYFMINAHLIDINMIIEDALNRVLEEDGYTVQFFNIEDISAPVEDYQAIIDAKERREKRFLNMLEYRLE